MDSNQAEPLHTGVTKDPASTPGYFRMLLAALPARYGLRAMINFAQEMPPVRWLDEHVLRMPEKMKIFDNFLHKKAGALPLEEITRKARFYDPKMTQQKLENWQGNSSQLTEGLPGFRDKVRDATLASHYDNLLGAGSLAVTGMYAMRVNSDIWHTFAETVAFETGKNPKDVTIRDLYASDNRIVQSTMRNFFSKTLTRLATDVIFFGRQLAHLPHAPAALRTFNFGEMGIGIKGFFLLRDILAKQTTFFEDLTQLIDKKLNPIKGIGEPISNSEVIDLYQKYALSHDTQAAFKDATIKEHRDGVDWDKAQKLFSRITDLMNQSYKYKHSSLDGVSYERREIASSSDFTLPKFLYLLGHGIIDPRRPEQSLAFVELANRHGIDAVKTVRMQAERGVPLSDAMRPYHIDLGPISPVNSEQHIISINDTLQTPKDSTTTAALPDTLVRDARMAGPLQSPSLAASLPL